MSKHDTPTKPHRCPKSAKRVDYTARSEQGTLDSSARDSLLKNASFGDEIDREAPQPMPAFVVLPSDRCRPGTAMLLGKSQ
jgi:hypothetical protein